MCLDEKRNTSFCRQTFRKVATFQDKRMVLKIFKDTVLIMRLFNND